MQPRAVKEDSGSRHKYRQARRKSFVRMVSWSANNEVKNQIGDSMSPATAVVFILNSLTGLTLLTLPCCFDRAGLLLGSALLFACMVMASITATFMCEALTIANALKFEHAVRDSVVNNPDLARSLTVQRKEFGSPPTSPERIRKCTTQEDFVVEVRHENPDHEFKIRERVELGPMGEAALAGIPWGLYMAKGIYGIVLLSTYGTVAAMVVTVSQSLATTLSLVLVKFGVSLHPDIAYRPCVLATFAMTLPLCFSDLQKTKKFTLVVMCLRCVAIVLMLVVSIDRALERWQQVGTDVLFSQLPLWREGESASVFGNAGFLFAIHHYIPSFVAPLRTQSDAPRVIFSAYFLAFILAVTLSVTGMLAWNGETALRCVGGGEFCRIQPLYNLNFSPLHYAGGAVGIFIVMYPTMTVASIPIVAITARNTLNQILGLSPPSPDKPYTISNILVVLVVLVPTFLVSAATQDIQAVVKYVGAYICLTLAFLCPIVMVAGLRHALHLDRGPEVNLQRPLKSSFATTTGYVCVVGFWGFAIAFATKKLFFSPPDSS